MGTWGTDLFSDDVACDIRDHYRELLEDGVDDAAATRQTIERFGAYLDEPDGIAVIALALTQSRLGRLDPGIRDRAISAIDRGADLEAWEQDAPRQVTKRRTVLQRAHDRLTGPQPAPRRMRRPRRVTCGLAAGDVLALGVPPRMTLLRVVRVRVHRLGETPVLEELGFEAAVSPTVEVMERMSPRTEDPIVFMHALSTDTRLFAFEMQGVGWEGAGFRKLGPIETRPGDAEASLPSAGISWAELAARIQRRSG
jgi:hypothetical protein